MIAFCKKATAQTVRPYKPNSIKILFLLDVSGSMKDKWNGKERMSIAKEVLLDIADSIQRKYPTAYMGLRVFGSDYPRAQKNCKDSRLVMPFTQNSSSELPAVLANLNPQGMTPIAYSLSQAAKDFELDSGSIHSIILITDGDENCDGDPCSISSLLLKRKISFRPFIIGLGVEKKMTEKFDCIGQFVNATDQQSLKETMGVMIRQSMNVTTAQINLIDRKGNPSITNIPFTLYDMETKMPEYNFIHTLSPNGLPDTLFLNPMGIYKLVVHSTPPVVKDSIELQIGAHNIIALDMPIGQLYAPCFGSSFSSNDAQVVIRNKANKIINVQDLNQRENYLADNYTANILTQPFYTSNATIVADVESTEKILNFGSAIFYSTTKVRATILYEQEKKWKKLNEHELHTKYETVKLQPGNYRMVYQPVGNIQTKSTQVFSFTIEEGRNLSISLD
jgi:Ca-activated chloride channel family protein